MTLNKKGVALPFQQFTIPLDEESPLKRQVTVRDETPGILGGGYNTFSSASKMAAHRFSNSHIKYHISQVKGGKPRTGGTSKRAQSRDELHKGVSALKFYETPQFRDEVTPVPLDDSQLQYLSGMSPKPLNSDLHKVALGP